MRTGVGPATADVDAAAADTFVEEGEDAMDVRNGVIVAEIVEEDRKAEFDLVLLAD